jgi:hypothetical protein
MQNKYLFDNGGYKLTADNKIFVNIDEVVSIAKQMLCEIIRIQIDKNIESAQKYIEKNFIWTTQQEIIAQKLQKVSKTLNGKLETPLADFLLKK